MPAVFENISRDTLIALETSLLKLNMLVLKSGLSRTHYINYVAALTICQETPLDRCCPRQKLDIKAREVFGFGRRGQNKRHCMPWKLAVSEPCTTSPERSPGQLWSRVWWFDRL
jgi:hypothetical protein